MWTFPAGGDPDAATLVPFTSPAGVPMRIAAAGPSIPGSDLAYSLVPNGRTTDFQLITSRTTSRRSALRSSPTSPASTGRVHRRGRLLRAPREWTRTRTSRTGTPASPAGIPTTSRWLRASSTRSAAGTPGTRCSPPTRRRRAPAPTLFGNGFTDDLFPVDEATRFYNQARFQFRAPPSRCSSSTTATPAGRTRRPTSPGCATPTPPGSTTTSRATPRSRRRASRR